MPTTHTVDCSAGEKIQDKIAIAKPGDTILVSGNCAENVIVAPEIVRITFDGQGKTAIQAPPKGDGFFVRGREITIKGFTISGGRDGIHLDHTSVGRIAGNTIEEAHACGIDVAEMSVARVGYTLRPQGPGPNAIRNCGEHGISVNRQSSARVVGNTIEGNKGSGVFVTRNSQADVFGNAISGNGADGLTASHASGVNLTNEDKLFDLGANRTEVKNAGFGLSGSVGGYVDGPAGTLDGAKGAKQVRDGCIDRLT